MKGIVTFTEFVAFWFTPPVMHKHPDAFDYGIWWAQLAMAAAFGWILGGALP